ncbi:hypothetical protein L2E82_18126 [Cichorium intybus]|uniref:Uncharacterized protein n=1 Tax=Cichorium intybus TaxID=13427 RepID=A0ACB9FA87_CICIN|nr:hypothetical protein L2E82_18126 [Cichorium intybus]
MNWLVAPITGGNHGDEPHENVCENEDNGHDKSQENAGGNEDNVENNGSESWGETDQNEADVVIKNNEPVEEVPETECELETDESLS